MILFNGTVVEQKEFPDGTPLLTRANLHFIGDYEDQKYTSIQNFLWKYENMGELFTLTCLVKELRNNDTNVRLSLHMPYVPNARQDRVQDVGTDVFTLKWFCEAINELKFEHVIITDVHSTVAPALLNNVHSQNALLFITGVLRKLNKGKDKFDLFCYPDNGARKKYSEYVKVPSVFGDKKRHWQTGEILGLDIIGDVKEKNILIVDDICSYGGTFFHCAKKLKELGANKIWLYVTHCENSILKGELIKSGLVEKIYTTDSIYTEQHPLIEVIHNF